MATKYLVLRTNIPVGGLFEATSQRAWSNARPLEDDLKIETFDGHEWNAGELRSDPQNVAVLDADVVLELSQPKAMKSAETADVDALLQRSGQMKMTNGVLAVNAHTSPYTGQGVTVAILDTGISAEHPAFLHKEIASKNFTRGGTVNDVSDEVGHGTHCAATICASPVGDVRVGVAPGISKLCVGKVLDGNGGGTLEMLLKGLIWAVIEQKASVVSMSLSYDLAGNSAKMIGNGLDPALAVQAAMRQQIDISKGIATLKAFLESQLPNVVFIAATGNESKRPDFVLDAGLPAAELFSVGAICADQPAGEWAVAPFSNARAHIVAPGVDVLSASHAGGWSIMSGTSMATPHVAGVAALWNEKLRNEGTLNVPGAVQSAIKAHAERRNLRSAYDTNSLGVGLVQAPRS